MPSIVLTRNKYTCSELKNILKMSMKMSLKISYIQEHDIGINQIDEEEPIEMKEISIENISVKQAA